MGMLLKKTVLGRHVRRLALLLLPLLMLVVTGVHIHSRPIERVSTHDLLEAMQSQSGYDPTVTTNVARFQAAVLLRLAEEAMVKHSAGTALFIGHQEWFDAFLRRTGLTKSTAPAYARLAYKHKQDQLISFSTGRVIESIEEGEAPLLAINVIVGWPTTAELPSRYSFNDTLSTPRLMVTNHREITYRLLDFGDMIVYDELEGLTGRPTSGILGLLFRMIGEGRVVQSRITITPDGLQINRVQVARGSFSVEETVTVKPDGVSQKGLPEDLPDLLTVETRLKRALKIRYKPLEFDGLAEIWAEGWERSTR